MVGAYPLAAALALGGLLAIGQPSMAADEGSPLPQVGAHIASPDPILSWAERDRRGLKLSRVATTLTLAGPGLYLIGDMANQIQGAELGARTVAGLALEGLGSFGMFAGPPLLLWGTARSTRALRAQSLDVSDTPLLLSVGLWAASAALILSPPQGWPKVLGLTCYAGSVVIAGGQLRSNHAARRDAGWLGLMPSPTPGGAALYGRF